MKIAACKLLSPLLLATFLVTISACKKINNEEVESPATNKLALSSFAADAPAGQSARFNHPASVAVDISGTIYIADRDNHSIRKITPAGIVSTIAGTGTAGFADGDAATAMFNSPVGITVDRSKNIYVADAGNHRIRMITPAGITSTLAGTGVAGFADAANAAAQFNSPVDVAIDGNGNIYVSDRGNRRIRKITRAGMVSTLAGTGEYGKTNGDGSVATFDFLQGLTCDAPGNVYVADGNHGIRKITRAGIVSTYESIIPYLNPTDAVLDAAGNLFVTESGNGQIIRITASGERRVLSGRAITISDRQTFADGPGGGAKFYFPSGIAIDPMGTTLYVADQNNHRIRTVEAADGWVNTFAGASQAAFFNGPRISPTFFSATGIGLDRAGNVYVLDQPFVRKITPAGKILVLAGGASGGFTDGLGGQAGFNVMDNLAVDKNGNVFVADYGNNRIRKITPGGLVTTIAGNSELGYRDGPGQNALFDFPISIAVNNGGLLFVGEEERGNALIRQLNPDALGNNYFVHTIAGKLHQPGTVDGVPGTITSPRGIAFDDSSNAYFTNGNMIRKCPGIGVVAFAGSINADTTDGAGVSARFNNPIGIAIDSFRNIYVADRGNKRIRKISRAGNTVTTVAGSVTGFTDGIGRNALFIQPNFLAVDRAGTVVYITDNHLRVRKLIVATGEVTTLNILTGKFEKRTQ